jgi:radical SAM superfamily enzyme
MAQTREEDFKLMSESGFYRLKIGVESGSEQVRNHIGKTETEEEIFYTFEMCRKYKLKVNLLIIVGYPTETIKDFEQTMDLLEKLSKQGYQDVIDRTVVNELYISTDTGLSKQVAELQIQNAETNSNWTRVLPNGEVLNSAERVRRLQLVIDYIKLHFNPILSVFSDKNKSTK